MTKVTVIKLHHLYVYLDSFYYLYIILDFDILLSDISHMVILYFDIFISEYFLDGYFELNIFT